MNIAIVGAGIAGLVTAIEALRAGHHVTLYEKTAVAAGASGRALGVLVPSGLKRPVDDLQRAGIAAWPELAGFVGHTTHTLVERFWREWPQATTRGCQQVNVPLLLELLPRTITALGGQILIEEITPESVPLLAETFDMVFLAAGLGNTLLGQQTQSISAGQAIKVLPIHMPSHLVIADNLYICPDWDKTVRIGSVSWDEDTAGDGTPRPKNSEALLVRAAAHVSELAGAEIVDAWVGYRPVSIPRLPLLRPVPPFANVWAVAGLGKIGVCLAPEVAKAVLDLSHSTSLHSK